MAYQLKKKASYFNENINHEEEMSMLWRNIEAESAAA